MKKLIKIGILVLGFLFSFAVFGQNEFRFSQNSMLGFKVGLTYTAVGLQPAVASQTGAFSYNAGFSYVYSNKEYVGIQIDLNYHSRKWIETFDLLYDTETDLQYIQMPLMTNISLGNGRMKYLINLGTYFAYKVGKTITSQLPEDHSYFTSFQERSERSGDFGLIIGGGLRFFSNIGTFQLDARYEYGYQNLYDEDNSGFRYSNMGVIQVGVYYYFLNLNKSK